MLSFVLLLLLLISGAQASYYGIVVSSVRDVPSGEFAIILDLKGSFSSCEEYDSWLCGGDCSGLPPVYLIDESRGEWCQKAFIWNYFSYPHIFNVVNTVLSWTENRNGIVMPKIPMFLDYRKRSDINDRGSPPQTTIIPLIRVPSNCKRNINLLVSDPDGDDVRCRYAAGSECDICTPPSVLNVSSSCSLSFSPTNSSDEGPYAVQMVMEDFPRQNVTLTDIFDSQVVKTPSDAMSSIPVQFVFRVDPAAPSCTEGEYLPRFLPPTPENGDQLYIDFNQTLEISIRAEATQAETTELLFSGPAGVTKSSSGSGNFTLTWTPIAIDRGWNKTLCFVVQANSSGSVYQSDLRCVFVTAGESPTTVSPPTTTPTPPATTTLTPTTNQPNTPTEPPTSSITNSTPDPDPGPYYVLALNAKISTSLSLETDSATIMNLIKQELRRQGLPSDIIVKLLSSSTVKVTTPAP